MLQVKRLNLDNSWYWSNGTNSCIVDPWLIGSEIDGFSWFNEQWHTKEPVPVNELPNYDFILITQNYEDHCHINTIAALDETKPIIATQKAFKKLKKEFPQRKLILLPDDGSMVTFETMNLMAIRPDRLIDPIYYAVVLQYEENKAIFCSPHGFTLDENQLEKTRNLNFKLLITTFTKFVLPSFLGGIVNPGMENVVRLFQQLRPEHVINTHDEKKRSKGLVTKLAKVEYANYKDIESNMNIGFINLNDYETRDIL